MLVSRRVLPFKHTKLQGQRMTSNVADVANSWYLLWSCNNAVAVIDASTKPNVLTLLTFKHLRQLRQQICNLGSGYSYVYLKKKHTHSYSMYLVVFNFQSVNL